jgi:hypothetical protein
MYRVLAEFEYLPKRMSLVFLTPSLNQDMANQALEFLSNQIAMAHKKVRIYVVCDIDCD